MPDATFMKKMGSWCGSL